MTRVFIVIYNVEKCCEKKTTFYCADIKITTGLTDRWQH